MADSRSDGRDALPRVRRRISRGFFLLLVLHAPACAFGAEALFNLLPPFSKWTPSLEVRSRIAPERVPTVATAIGHLDTYWLIRPWADHRKPELT